MYGAPYTIDFTRRLSIWLSLYSSRSNKELETGGFVFSIPTLAVVTFAAPRLLQILLQLFVLKQRAHLGCFITTLLFLLFSSVSCALSSFRCHSRNFPNRDNNEFQIDTKITSCVDGVERVRCRRPMTFQDRKRAFPKHWTDRLRNSLQIA